MTLTPINKCPTCGYCLDAATCVNGERTPRPDDVSACLKCGELLVFTKDLTMRAMDLNDMLGLDERTKSVLMRTQAMIRRERPLEKKPTLTG